MLVGCKEEHPVTKAPTSVRVQRMRGVGGLRAAPDGTSNREIEGIEPMNRMRISLFYLGSYLAIIGLGLLFVPHDNSEAWARIIPKIESPNPLISIPATRGKTSS
jgi:hypothetical protein